MTPNRSVALLTPLAAVLAGVAAEWLAKHFPGVDVPRSALEEVFLGGVAAVLAPAALWLHGWQKYEARQEGSTADRFEAALESHDRALATEPTAADAGVDDDSPAGLAEADPVGLDDDADEPDFDELFAIELTADPEAEFDDGLLDDEGELDAGGDDDDDDDDDEVLAELTNSSSPSRVG